MVSSSIRSSHPKAAASCILAGALALTLGAFATGCSSQEAQNASSQQTQQEEKAEEQPEASVRILGDEGDGSLSMKLVNNTGKDITGVAVAPSVTPDAQFEANLITDNVAWRPSEEVELYAKSYEPEAEGAESDIVVKPTYNIQLTFADGTTCVLHQVTFPDNVVATIDYDADGNFAYLTIDENGQKSNTLESEKAIKAAEDAVLQAADEAVEDAEEEVATQNRSTGNSNDYDYDYDYDYDTGSSEESGASQSADACIPEDDLVLNE